MHVLKVKLSTEKCFLSIKTLDYAKKKNSRFLFCYRFFFFCMTSKIATKHRSRQESAQSSTVHAVHVVHYLHRRLWKLTGKSRFSCFFLEQRVVQEDDHDMSTANGCSGQLRKLPAGLQSTALVPVTTFLLQPKHSSAFMGGSAQLLASFIFWNGDIFGFETPSGLRWWLRISTVS